MHVCDLAALGVKLPQLLYLGPGTRVAVSRDPERQAPLGFRVLITGQLWALS